MIRSFSLAGAVVLGLCAPLRAQDTTAPRNPVLRASVTVSGDIVRVGDFVDHAGDAAQIALFRAPDPGTTGTLPAAQVIAALRAQRVIGVDAQDINEVEITRVARAVAAREVQERVARVLANRNGLGDVTNLAVTFDRDIPTLQLDPSNSGSMQAVTTRYNPASRRFDILFEIANDANAAPTRLRFTGTVVETIETAVLGRSVERGEILKASDVITERRPKGEVQNDAAGAAQAIGMAVKRPMRAGAVLRLADLGKPDLVQRDQSVTLVFETAGIYLTMRGKALESGVEGDVISVMNLASKRTLQGTVIGLGQISVTSPMSRLTTASLPDSSQPASRRNIE